MFILGYHANFSILELGGLAAPQASLLHEARLARNTMSNRTYMQDKYCGHCYDIHPIQSQYTLQ